MASRRFYTSSNGDTWDLVRDGDARVTVGVHRPNLASGGTARTYDLEAFLSHERHAAQVIALVGLIGSLVEGA